MPKGIYNRKTAIPNVYVAKESFTTLYNGNQLSILKGVTVHEGHPLLAGLGALFVLQKVDYPWEVAPEPEPEAAPEPVVPDQQLSSVARAEAFTDAAVARYSRKKN